MNKVISGLLSKQGRKPVVRPVITYKLKDEQAIIRYKYGRQSLPLDGIVGFATTKIVVAEGDARTVIDELEKEFNKGTLNTAVEWVQEREAARQTLLRRRKQLIG